MRCRAALEKMASLPNEERLDKEPELSSHLAECAGCAAAWREHRALLGLLGAPGEGPVFGDLSPAVLARIDAGATRPRRRWQWAAAAALAMAALALGYLFGQMSAEAAPPADSMAATYQAALTGQAGSSTYLAYLEAGSTASARSAP
jgi:anti-sigma factor RsiW